MSLDQNLFTLTITPREVEPLIVDLVDPRQVIHYRKERKDGVAYDFSVFDPLSDSLLATVTAPAATSKHKTIQLYNPSVPVELKSTGLFTFRWRFKWEEHEFEWKKEECFIIRKPDPPVLIAITKEPAKKSKTRAVQILDYNIRRFDVHDRKGLEIILLSALLSFMDYFEAKNAPQPPTPTTAPAKMEAQPLPIQPSDPEAAIPVIPKRTGLERIAELQRGKLNEILVTEECEVGEYAEYCSNLLENDNITFVVLRAGSGVTIPKVLQAAQHTKRKRLDAGDRHELLQHIHYDSEIPQTDIETAVPSDKFLVRLSKPRLVPAAHPVAERHMILKQPSQPPAEPITERRIEVDDGRGKRNKGKAKEEVPQAADSKPKSKAEKKAEEKNDRKRREREEQAEKQRLKEEAEERRRKEAAEKKKRKEKPAKESKTKVAERKTGETNVQDDSRNPRQGKAREQQEKKSRGKGKSETKSSPERGSNRLTKMQTHSFDVLQATRSRQASVAVQQPESHRRSEHGSSSRLRTPSFDTGVYPAHAIQHLRNASASGASHPYPAMQRPITIFGSYANSRAPPVVFPAEPMPMV